MPRVRASVQRPLIFLFLTAFAILSCSTHSQKSPPQVPQQDDPQAEAPSGHAAKPSSAIPARRDFPVNSDIKPCQDFYEYACSKVNASFKLRDDRSKHTFSFSDSNERILDFKKKYFSEMSTAKPSGPIEADLQNYYLACMNEKAQLKEELDLVESEKKAVTNIKSRDALQEFLSARLVSKEEHLLAWGPTSNLDRPQFNDLFFNGVYPLFWEKSYYDRPEVQKAMLDLYTQYYMTIGADRPTERAQWVLRLENEVGRTYPAPEVRRERWSQRMTATKLQIAKKYPELRLNPLLSRLPKNVNVRDWVHEMTEMYQRWLAKEDIEAVKSFYLYRALAYDMDDAFPDFFKVRFKFENEYLGGPVTRSDRHERCTKAVMGAFPMELDSILIAKMFPNFPEKKVISLSEKIRNAIAYSVETNTWLSGKAKKEALRKMRTARLQLVQPQTRSEWNFKKKGTYRSATPIANRREQTYMSVLKQIDDLKGPIDTGRWEMSPLVVNAYYDPSYNKFVLPVGILQYPFFDPDGPEEANIAGIGSVIGHELGHGIDDQGALYDADGHLQDWMTPADHDNFKKRTHALVEQYAKIGHNGEHTLGENIADLVGVTAAYSAAFSGKTPSIEQQQQFFLGYARSWCTVERPAYAELIRKTNPHSLSYARVNEPIKHLAAFQEAFSCEPGQPMVIPDEKKVRVW